MPGMVQETRRKWLGKRGAAGAVAGAVAAAAVAVAALGSAGGALASGPAGPGSGTPAGWAPAPFRLAQLSVPPLWLVESQSQYLCGIGSKGMIFAGTGPVFPAGTHCHPTASVAWIRPAGHLPRGIAHRKPSAVIHGIPVFRLHSGKGSILYLAPRLGVRVGARGPLARRVLATLTRSPLAVVLSRQSGGQVTGTWTRHQFGGIRFATPSKWDLHRASQWATCGTGQDFRSLLLINATRPPAALPCPFPVPTAAADQAQPGLTVVTGKFAAQSVSEKFTHCLMLHGARICLSSSTGQGGLSGSVLIFSVSRPHHNAATFFVLGLSGSGAGARAVLDSIRTLRG